MTKDEALDLALEALTPFSTPNWAGTGVDKANEAITAIKQARSAPVQEPKQMNGKQPPASWNTPAAQRQWVRLTNEEIAQIYLVNTDKPLKADWLFARAIEAKLKELNT
jgi:hypothetical protein